MSIQNRRPLTEDSPAHDDFWNPDVLKVVNTRSPQMRQTFEKVKSVAPTKTTVLLLGDTGVGKGTLAKLSISTAAGKMSRLFMCIAGHCRIPW